MGDLDILVHPEDMQKAIRRLLAGGYHVATPPWVNVGSDVELSARGRMATLEVHWGLTPAGKKHYIPIEDAWKTVVAVRIAGTTALALAPEELLLYLCYHAATKHLYMQGLRSLVDVDQTLRHYGNSLRWDRAAELARAWGLARAVRLTLYLCRQYLDTPVPDFAVDKTARGVNAALVQEAIARMSMQESALDVASSKLYGVRGERWLWHRLKVLVREAFRLPSPPHMERIERAPVLTLYYTLRRLIYLLGHYHRALVQIVFAALRGRGTMHRQQGLRAWLEG
jgi:hypothetical protein